MRLSALLLLNRQRRTDEPYMRECLRKIAQGVARAGISFFRKQPKIVPVP
jgi:hypothetical protein